MVEDRVKVLFVEDDFVNLNKKIVTDLTNVSEFFLDVAESLIEAEKKITRNDYDVILSNIKTYEKDCFALQKSIDTLGKDIPFIFFNDNGSKLSEELMMKCRSSFIVHKSDVDPGNVKVSIKLLKEKKKAQEIIQISNELIRSIFSSIHDSICVTDLKGIIVNLNTGTLRIHGYEKEGEMLGRSAFEFIHKSNHERAMLNMANTLEKGLIKDVEYLFLKKDGSTFYGELTANVLYDKNGKPSGYVAIVKDITERRQKEEIFRLLYDSVQNAINGLVAIEIDGTINFCNDAFSRILGYKKEDIINREIFYFFNDESKKILAQKISLEPTKEGWHDELIARKSDGVFFTVMIYVTPFCHKDGDLKGYLVSFDDISSKKKLEMRLREKVNDMESFGHILAHDLKTPLITIMEFMKLFYEQTGEKLDSDETDIVERVIACSKESLDMIDDLKRYYFIDKEEDKYEWLSVGDLVNQIVRLIKEKNKANDVEINVQSGLPVIIAKPIAIYHIFYNLLENAVKFGARSINICYKKLNDNYCFSIADDGWGIDKYSIPKIFEIFVRSSRAKKESFGTGIGLAVVKRLVEKHNGNVWVESNEGEGSIFYFEIPVTPG